MKPKKIAIVPSDTMEDYLQAGYDKLGRYYNPMGMFDEVYLINPYEKKNYEIFGLNILSIDEKDFKKVIEDIKPDIIRGYGGYWPSDLVCSNRIPNIPVVISVHDTRNIHKSIKYADLIVSVSNAVTEKILSLGIDPSKIRLIPNRMDKNIFHPVKDPALLNKISSQFPVGKYILHIGRKHDQKNLDTVINSLFLLPKEYSCIFIGKGDKEPYINLAKQLGVNKRCYWIDSVKNDELPLWYSWCDCFCTPSKWEGFGLVFVEAAACQAAIITSDIGPMNEYLVHNQNAYLVSDYTNPNALAKAIMKVCEDDEYRARISTEASKIAEIFSTQVIDEQEAHLYQEILEHKKTNKIDLGNSLWAFNYKFKKSLWKLLFKNDNLPNFLSN